MLKELGCADAISLDAGSAVLLLRREDGSYELFNRSALSAERRPAYTRPTPVLLGVRER